MMNADNRFLLWSYPCSSIVAW